MQAGSPNQKVLLHGLSACLVAMVIPCHATSSLHQLGSTERQQSLLGYILQVICSASDKKSDYHYSAAQNWAGLGSMEALLSTTKLIAFSLGGGNPDNS